MHRNNNKPQTINHKPQIRNYFPFAQKIELPKSFESKPVMLRFGNVVDRDSIYLNGVFIGSIGYQYPPRKCVVPANIIKAGKNIISVHVINSSGKGGFYQGKPYYLATGNDTIDLKGLWQYQVAAILSPLPPTTTFTYQPMALFNAMISPLLNYSIKGVIWYQGESNTKNPIEYRSLFPAVINNWRQKWRQGPFPFLYVQLANFMEVSKTPSESNWATLREAQLKTLAVPGTAMVVATDIGEWNDIHPLNKGYIGKRLSLAAQKIAYNDKTIIHSRPLYRSMKINGNNITIYFSNTGKGLKTNDGLEPGYFSIEGADKKFVWARAKIKGHTIIVWNNDLKNPVVVRYAWADNPQGANLYNKEGLPASPFRTDD